ncbi:MAG: CBS domain-containing protein [Clostridia bacterium]|nr:CBS domain-containing protein [Clostridia bacterium]
MKAKDIMTTELITVNPEATVEDVAKVLSQHKISGVPVLDEGGKLVGIVSEGDLLIRNKELHVPSAVSILGGVIWLEDTKKFAEELRKAVAVKVADIMTTDVYTVDEEADIRQIATLMADKKINRIPVVRDGRLVGIVSRGDIVGSLVK